MTETGKFPTVELTDIGGRIVEVTIAEVGRALQKEDPSLVITTLFGLSPRVIMALRHEYLKRGGPLDGRISPEDVEKLFSKAN